MNPDYENFDFIFSKIASDKNSSQQKGNSTVEQERKVTSPKGTKVLLTLLGLSLVFALGGLCALWMIYNHKLVDFESQNEQHINNSTAMKKKFDYLTARYNTLRKCMSLFDAPSCNLSVGDWIACHGKLYLFSSDKLNWWSSRDVCVSKGADLVTITSQSEQDFLVSKINESHWIGLNDLDTEGHWVWVNNRTLNETGVQFWSRRGVKQPNNGKQENPSGENCARLGDGISNLDFWFDASCEKKSRFICEIEY